MVNKKQKYGEILWYFTVFAFFFVWFSRIHPLIVYDGDDWTYIAYVRRATPIWGEWNPSKVFPEVIMPFVSSVILHTLVPLLKDYITAFTVGHALVVSAFITLYTWCFSRLLKRIFSLPELTCALISALFLVFHFLVLRTNDAGNLYLFFCEDLNCYYNYLIPALLNACIVMHMIENPAFDTFLQKGCTAKKGIFYVIVYLAIFSNMTVSGILAAYAGSQLLLHLLRQWKTFRLKAYINENIPHFAILIGWFVSAVYELSGGRAAAASRNTPLYRSVYAAFWHLKNVLLHCNPLFWATVFTIILLCLVFLFRTRGKDTNSQVFLPGAVTILVSGAAIAVYSVLLCAMVNPYCMNRSEYLLPMFFYGFLIVLLALAYVVKQYPGVMTVLPLLVLFLTSDINTNGKTFEDSLMSDFAPSVCADISRDILNQFLAADEAGLTEMTLYVPLHVANPEEEDNWPHSFFLMPRISRALYEQGIISREIGLKLVADPAYNERFHLPIPEIPSEN